ncbi:MAG: EAL domain-containing protein [Treponema sp.]|nr:EAL domain-containing protein [Treponema sp.]
MDANYYDYLTGLPTMTYFFEISAARKEKIIKNFGQPTLMFLTLSGMKSYNQRKGFFDGNEFLKSFAKLLAQYFENENCCRLGGVHFAVIADDRNIKEKLQKFIEESRLINPEIETFPHVGIYQYSNEDVSINIACDRAKLACDTLKNERSSGIAYYDQTIRHAEENHRYIIENLNKAISERWITVYYQPIVRGVNGKVCDEEALARWIDPVKGFLSPADFIPVLEEEKLIYRLDLYMLERVLEKMKYFQSNEVPLLPQSINLSRSDFESCDIVEEIRTRVDLSGIPRSKITIEITESIIGGDFDFMKRQIIRFKELGFPVWMDDFGSGYSSLNVLREIPFDVIKFDMSFMRNFDKKDNGKVILAELMKMAFALGVDTVCEGVETEEQIQFLREIGCSKIQGYYYGKPIPFETVIENLNDEKSLGFENPDETFYYDAVGRANLQNLNVISYGNEGDFNNVFNTIPLAVLEISPESSSYVRTNQAYRNFFKRFFGFGITSAEISIKTIMESGGAAFFNSALEVAKDGKRMFVDETLPDGSIANYFIRKLAENPIKGKTALAVGVLSIRDAEKGATYENIAKALATDYFDLYYVNLETEEFTQYSSKLGEEMMTTERHSENFFELARNEALKYLYEEDQQMFVEAFTKENVLKELSENGTFAITYRLVSEDKTPFYVNMKVMRMQKESKYIIVAVGNVDAQMKQREALEQARQEQTLYSRLMSLSGDFLAMYVVDPKNEDFTEYSSVSLYGELQLPKHGTGFFSETRKNAEAVLHPEDIEYFKENFTKENVLSEIKKKGIFTLHARIMLGGEYRPYSTRISMVKENGEDKLIVGTRL